MEYPEMVFRNVFSRLHPPTVDQSHILRAVMMLYVSLGFLLAMECILRHIPRRRNFSALHILRRARSRQNLSVIVDGVPSPLLILYIFMELGIVPVCIWLLRRENQREPSENITSQSTRTYQKCTGVLSVESQVFIFKHKI